jgi:hypothetical protein
LPENPSKSSSLKLIRGCHNGNDPAVDLLAVAISARVGRKIRASKVANSILVTSGFGSSTLAARGGDRQMMF